MYIAYENTQYCLVSSLVAETQSLLTVHGTMRSSDAMTPGVELLTLCRDDCHASRQPCGLTMAKPNCATVNFYAVRSYQPQLVEDLRQAWLAVDQTMTLPDLRNINSQHRNVLLYCNYTDSGEIASSTAHILLLAAILYQLI